ncbi:toxin-antitoxin system, toxin component family protein [Streptomyces sp. NPDC058914]|uniref:toxin-antitoxin system, toxin component family protein n=1 Tax=Streptomyces TaxID=1883 RepID=UPI0036BFC2DA
MDIAGALRRARTGPVMRSLIRDLVAALRHRPHPPGDVGALCRALCAQMGARRGGRPVELRFERFPDELGVTGLWVEFQDFDLVIVEERAEDVQRLVILGHELWHLHAGHRHHHAAAAHALAERSGWRDLALAVAARNGSREADEAAADDFGHLLAAAVRPYVGGPGDDAPEAADRVQRSLGYRGRGGRAR